MRVRVDYMLKSWSVELSRVPCVGERVDLGVREGDAIVWRVIHHPSGECAATVRLTSESGYAEMRDRRARRSAT